MMHLFTEFTKGGWFMYLIGLLLIFSLTIIVERVWQLVFKYNIDGSRFIAEIKKYIMANDVAGAINYCNREPDLAICKVVKAGLMKANRSRGEIREAINEMILEVIPPLEKNTHLLPMIANVATLLGLLGTITGLISAFSAIEATDPARRAELLSKGIAMAMYTTAFGLITAIPSLFAHAILYRRTVRIIDDIDQAAVKLINILGSRPEGQKS